MAFKLDSPNVKKLLYELSVPATIGMVVNALYNIIDSIFVGNKMGEIGHGALAIAFPIQMIIMALAFLIGVGGASVYSRALGSNEKDKALRVFNNSLVYWLILGIILVTFMALFTDDILILFGATENLLPYAKDYFSIIVIGMIPVMGSMVFNNMLRAEGSAKVAMTSMIIGTGLNIILDPIFIYGLNLDIKGAAIATVISQITAVTFVLLYTYLSKKTTLKYSVKHMIPNIKILGEIFAIGISAFIRNSVAAIIMIVINNQLKKYSGDMGLNVFGVVNRFVMFLYLPAFGIVQGLQPIAGYNWGAKRFSKVFEVTAYAFKIVGIYLGIAFVLSFLFSKQIFFAFGGSETFIALGQEKLRIALIGLPIIFLQIVSATFFQAIGKATEAALVSLSRQVIFFIPLVIILPMHYGDLGIWIAFPIADILSSLLSALLYYLQTIKIKKMITIS